MKDVGPTARPPRAGVAGRAALLAAHSIVYLLAAVAALAAVLTVVTSRPDTTGAIEDLVTSDTPAVTVLTAWLAGTFAIAIGLAMTLRRTVSPIPFLLRGVRSSQVAAAATWCVTTVGFVVYLASVDSFMETYGGVGTGLVLLLWVTLFSVLYYAIPDPRVPGLSALTPVAAAAIAVAWLMTCGALAVWMGRFESITSPYWAVGTVAILYFGVYASNFGLLRHIGMNDARPQPSPMADRVDRVVAPSAALRNPTAQGRMISVLGARAARMSDREMEMMDWGFAFGVAWAVARSQDPAAPEEVLSRRALDATQAVYQAYRGSPAPELAGVPALIGTSNGTADGSAPHAHTDGS